MVHLFEQTDYFQGLVLCNHLYHEKTKVKLSSCFQSRSHLVQQIITERLEDGLCSSVSPTQESKISVLHFDLYRIKSSVDAQSELLVAAVAVSGELLCGEISRLIFIKHTTPLPIFNELDLHRHTTMLATAIRACDGCMEQVVFHTTRIAQ